MLGPQFSLATLATLADSRGVVSGTPARRFMRSLNVRPVGRIDAAPGEHNGVEWDYDHFGSRPGSTVGSEERLYTRQSHLHMPTLMKYAAEPHAWEYTVDPDTGLAYLPQVYSDDVTGRQWVDEGHHRILAARLNGDDVRAWRGRAL